ncbi:hypothetical protein V8D89_014553 [Ganoderma adspersum]
MSSTRYISQNQLSQAPYPSDSAKVITASYDLLELYDISADEPKQPLAASESPIPPPKMRRPNPFVNLDRILTANATMAFDPTLNFPPMSLQITNGDPERHTHEDVRDRPTAFGRVYPDDRHIVISHEVSTIIQFRNLDYGMERCALHFEVPSPFGRFDPMVNLMEYSQADIQ